MITTKFKIESGMQLLARLIRKPEIGNFYPPLFQNCPRNGDIIEISCNNGLHLLVDIISEILVTYKLQGKEVGILYFNTDGNINYDLLLNVIKKKIILYSEQQENVSTDLYMERKLHQILSNLHILEVNDATQFWTSIYNLENMLLEHSNISVVIFDTLTAFYWSEQGFKITKMDLYVKNLLHKIQKVTRQYKLTCVYTRPHYFYTNKETDNTESSLTETINIRIQVTKICEKDFQVYIKTNEMEYVKHFEISNGEIKWL